MLAQSVEADGLHIAVAGSSLMLSEWIELLAHKSMRVAVVISTGARDIAYARLLRLRVKVRSPEASVLVARLGDVDAATSGMFDA